MSRKIPFLTRLSLSTILEGRCVGDIETVGLKERQQNRVYAHVGWVCVQCVQWVGSEVGLGVRAVGGLNTMLAYTMHHAPRLSNGTTRWLYAHPLDAPTWEARLSSSTASVASM
jgi:hypothetical protein